MLLTDRALTLLLTPPVLLAADEALPPAVRGWALLGAAAGIRGSELANISPSCRVGPEFYTGVMLVTYTIRLQEYTLSSRKF